MRRKIHLVSLIIGLSLFIFDLGSDIYLAVRYYEDGELWWFGFTFSLTIVPLAIINFIGSRQFIETTIGRKVGMFFSCSSIFTRYIEEFKLWKRADWKNSLQFYHSESPQVESMYLLAYLGHIETITESAPQWCLQTYIMLRQWRFPWYTILSTVFSLLSLAWSITTLEKARTIKDGYIFNLKSTVAFLIWQLSDLVSRLFAIVMFAFAFRYHVFSAMTIHWLVVFGALIFNERKKICREGGEGLGIRRLLQLWLESFPFLFHVSESRIYLVNNPIRDSFLMSGVLDLENVLMLMLSLMVSNLGESYMNVLKPTAISFVVGGMMLGATVHTVYSNFCYPTRNIDIDVEIIDIQETPHETCFENQGLDSC